MSLKYNEYKSRHGNRIYYSGANVKVYFGDVWVKELASIQFSLEENVAPIYGFNSYMFDKVARGTRLVSGAFILNHTEAGYLGAILEEVHNNINYEDKLTTTPARKDMLKQDVLKANSSRNIENLLSIGSQDKYSDYIIDLKKSYWGPQKASNSTMYRSSEAREYDTNYFADKEGSKFSNMFKKHGFNILLDFSPSANTRDFQECIRGAKDDASLSQTYRSIIGVHITGENQIIVPDGQPIQTQYNFVARDLDGDITQLSMKYNQLENYKTTVEIPEQKELTGNKRPVINVSGSDGSGGHGDQIVPL